MGWKNAPSSDEIYCGENHDYQHSPKASDYYNRIVTLLNPQQLEF